MPVRLRPSAPRFAGFVFATALILAMLLGVACGGPAPRPTSSPRVTPTSKAASQTPAPGTKEPDRPTIPYPVLTSEGVKVQPGTFFGTYKTELAPIQTPSDVMRITGRVTLVGAKSKNFLVTNYLETFCYSSPGTPELCHPLPENVRQLLDLPYSQWWVGEYVLAQSGETWIWEMKRPKLPTGQLEPNIAGFDLYVYAQPQKAGEFSTVFKFENLNATFGQTVRFPDISLDLSEAAGPTAWVFFPER
ncbi:MAG: hypothetical protein HY683_01840 [Chloroflexi bacterium]|nr:hypothetical protein [Chloroflexota bacterium]